MPLAIVLLKFYRYLASNFWVNLKNAFLFHFGYIDDVFIFICWIHFFYNKIFCLVQQQMNYINVDVISNN